MGISMPGSPWCAVAICMSLIVIHHVHRNLFVDWAQADGSQPGILAVINSATLHTWLKNTWWGYHE